MKLRDPLVLPLLILALMGLFYVESEPIAEVEPLVIEGK